MKNRSMIYTIMRWAGTVAFVVWCSCSTGTQLAGGSGSGNPGSATASIVVGIDTVSAGLAKTVAQSVPLSPNAGGQGPRGLVKVADLSGTVFNIDSVFLLTQRITFIPDTDRLCDSLMARISGPLMCGDFGPSLEGDEYFEAVSRTALPAIGRFFIPAVAYRGIVLHFGQHTPAQSGVPAQSAIEIRGTFSYMDTMRAITITCSTNVAITCRTSDSVFTVNRNDTLSLAVLFTSRAWFANVDIGGAIARGELHFESDGSLTISDRSTPVPGAGSSIAAKIRSNIMSAGRLQVGR